MFTFDKINYSETITQKLQLFASVSSEVLTFPLKLSDLKKERQFPCLYQNHYIKISANLLLISV